MTPDITLYREDGSCAMVPHIFLHELGIPFTGVVMKRGAAVDGTMSEQDYLRISPKGYVPAMKIDDIVITEMPALLTYLASIAEGQGKSWLGAQGVQRAKVYEWLTWCSGTVHGYGFAMFWRPGRFTEDPDAYESIRAKGMQTILSCYDRIEERLAANVAAGGDESHAVGSSFTVVDVNLHSFWRWGQDKDRMGMDMKAKYPRYSALAKAVEGLQSAQKAMAIEGEELNFEV